MKRRTVKATVTVTATATEKVDEPKLVNGKPEYLKPSAELCVKNICRETIRKHLLQMSDVNLFPLPQLMTSYLLYDVTLDVKATMRVTMAKTILTEQLSEQCSYTFMSSLMANHFSHLTRKIDQ